MVCWQCRDKSSITSLTKASPVTRASLKTPPRRSKSSIHAASSPRRPASKAREKKSSGPSQQPRPLLHTGLSSSRKSTSVQASCTAGMHVPVGSVECLQLSNACSLCCSGRGVREGPRRRRRRSLPAGEARALRRARLQRWAATARRRASSANRKARRSCAAGRQ